MLREELPVQNIRLVVAVGKKRVEVRRQVLMQLIWNHRIYNVLALDVRGLFTDLVIGLN